MTLPRKLDTIKRIVIHCADTPNGYDRYGASDIAKWHTQDNKWDRIGYHFVIEVDGAVVPGRELEAVGSHAKNHNEDSVGICLVGRDAFTEYQWHSLQGLLIELQDKLPRKEIQIIGHRDLSTKTCPGFDVYTWLWERKGVPEDRHVCKVRRYHGKRNKGSSEA